ncbi:Predicted transglutaminase-like cysteine proteinase [Cohaesibacter sp. ES.047]|uniref:transglutaminase-like cysteine peptidase n=1 Tax=Cohaesibacter sp. ES.047 TaxID=1798205 RepID=UPI000BB87973|nr:transglutaminase-like cysteine peptidase [Cohaesibacter sp. ES.047]SNY94179.1 Predicted transglutaminase-like cysteine proteinase [Cohaesibacter sp. ES.047]
MKKRIWGFAFFCFTSLAFISQSQAASFSPFMTLSGKTSAPIGHVEFCRQNPRECNKSFSVDQAVRLTPENWEQLININNQVNQTVKPVTDQELYRTEEVWTYPGNAGDCEDYALLKRRLLNNLGWPETALLITVVREVNGNGHAVLTVRTDRGDLILDNQDSRILPWDQTPYHYVKRQAALHPSNWTAILDQR